jgi:hypothetical protein
VDKDGKGITNDENVRFWKSVLAHPTVLHLPVKTQEKCTINGPESKYFFFLFNIHGSMHRSMTQEK